MKKIYILLLFIYLSFLDNTAQGQTATLVKDINAGLPNANIVILHNPFSSNNLLYFFADDGVHGWELWKTDGTTGGTAMLKDINPGIGSGICDFFAETPSFIWAGATTLYFSANDGVNGCELWKTDGTIAGTIMVKNINESGGDGSSEPNDFVLASNNKIFFTADDWTNHREVWVSDGTANGTKMVKNIVATGTSYPSNLCAFGNKVIFFASDGVSTADHGDEPWVSDGTETGTFMLKDINIGSYRSDPSISDRNFILWNNKVYFCALNASSGNLVGNGELWVTDGTTSGTYLLKEIEPLTTHDAGSFPFRFTAADDALYFVANSGQLTGYELWKTDGTTVGTVMVKDIWAGGVSSSIQNMKWVNDRLYFAAQDGTSAAIELWQSDGTSAGTQLVTDINTYNYSSSYPFTLTKIGDNLYVWAESNNVGRELFQINGNTSQMITNLNTNYNIDFGASCSEDGYSNYFSVVNNRLFFAATADNYGLELFSLDLPTSVENTTSSSAISIYPNPVSDNLHIALSGNTLFAQAALFDIMGKQVTAWKNIDTKINTISIDQLPIGTYFLTIKQKETAQQFIIIKK